MKIIEFDVVFISYDEPNADIHYADLCTKVPWAKRVHGVKGSDRAHKAAANAADTKWFITVDADNIVDLRFFDINLDMSNDKIKVYSWCSRNVINGLQYGNGGLKIWNKEFVLGMKTHENSNSSRGQVDFCWEEGYQNFPLAFSDSIITGSPFQAWRAGFREGVKLTLLNGAKVLSGNIKEKIWWHNIHRLRMWSTVGLHEKNGNYAVLGTRMGTWMTNCTDWNYIEVRDFEILKNIYKNNVNHNTIEEDAKNLAVEIKHKLGLDWPWLDAQQSEYTLDLYNETMNLNDTYFKMAVPAVVYDIFYVSKNVSNNDNWDKVKSKYPSARKIDNVQDFNQIRSQAFTKMFWVIWDDVILCDSFDLLDYRVSSWDNSYVHVFKNSSHYDGICLFPKNLEITQKEFDNRLFTKKKEINIVASTPKPYDIFTINSYDDYLKTIKISTTEMFWCIWPEVEIIYESILNLYFSYHNSYDRSENHVFKNLCNGIKTFYNGVVLFSKHKLISQEEFDIRYLDSKKEHNLLVSKIKPCDYDIVFISYNEPNAEENYKKLKKRFPKTKRVDKVYGIHQAHIQAAKIAKTEMFWVVDGDANIINNFDFKYELLTCEKNTVHVWRSQNPINDLEYGYGGVKLLPKTLTLKMNTSSLDMSTSISKNFKAVPIVSNITSFNTDPFNTWKSAFRECVKLSSKVIDRQDDNETNERLNIWCTKGYDKPFGEFSIKGALEGRKYGYDNKDNKEKLKLINDFGWLKNKFNKM